MLLSASFAISARQSPWMISRITAPSALAGYLAMRIAHPCDDVIHQRLADALWTDTKMGIDFAGLIEAFGPLAEQTPVVVGGEHRGVVGPGIALIEDEGIAINR